MRKNHQKELETKSQNVKTKVALTPEGRENQCIALAYDLVEKRLREGTATSQETVHFLKLATSQSQLEKEKMELENELIKAKTKAYSSDEELKEMYKQAMTAFNGYAGREAEEDD